MNRLRPTLPLATALLAVIAAALVAPIAAADTSTTSTSSPSTSSTTTPAGATTSTVKGSTTSTLAPSAPTSTVPGSSAPALTSTPSITPASSGVPVFIVAGTPRQAPANTLIQITEFGDLATIVAAPSPELSSTIGQFYAQGGGDAYLWLTTDEQADTLISATTEIGAAGTTADLFVIPGLAALDGQDYLDVAAALGALAQSQLGVALLDPPTTVVAAMQAAWPDVSALVTLAGQVRDSLAAPSSAALYAAPLVDSSSGVTVPASVVMAGLLAAQDMRSGVWVAAAGTGITALGVDVLLPVTNVQLATLGMEVNAFRDLPNYGTVMWGDRTLAPDSLDSKYLSVVRTADWVHRSISQGVGFAAFEPDDQAARAALDQAVTPFLTTLWTNGALFGLSATQAFQLTFDTAPPGPSGAEGGRRLQVGLALVDPADFQWFAVQVPTPSG